MRRARLASIAPASVLLTGKTISTGLPKRAQPAVATMVRTIYQQPSPEEVHAQHRRVVAQLQARFPKAAELLAEAGPDILAFAGFPVAHWRQIWSNNPLERLNKEIRRRTDVVGIFPNRSAIRRLIGAVLAEQHDEWATSRRYLNLAGPVIEEVAMSIAMRQEEAVLLPVAAG